MAADHSWRALIKPGTSDDFFESVRAGFDCRATGFSAINAWWLSELCRLIYKRDGTEGVAAALSRSDWLTRVGLVESRFFSHPNLQAALVETVASGDRAFAVVVFRGTAGRLSNWRFNLDMAPVAWPAGGRVHRGFRHLLMTLWQPIAASLEGLDKPLYFTGHSLGGALATLAASIRPPRGVYTFGAPRVGDAAFVRTLAAVDVFNVTNGRDIVPHLPPSGRHSRFIHAGTRIANADLPGPYRPLAQAPPFLADHAPLNYSVQLPVTARY